MRLFRYQCNPSVCLQPHSQSVSEAKLDGCHSKYSFIRTFAFQTVFEIFIHEYFN